MKKEDLDYLDFKNKYGKKIEKELGEKPQTDMKITTRDYDTFKETFMPTQLSLYEKACNFSENIIPIGPDKEKVPDIQEAISISHLNVTPKGTTSFAAMVSLCIIFFGIIFGYMVPYAVTGGEFNSFFFVIFAVFMGLVAFIPATKIPFIASNMWRMKASNQMVLSVFYIVTYMRHTPNLELAIDFASEHLAPPLSLDLKKVVWDIETGKYENINESLDNYLQKWKEYNPEYIESMHLIQGSLYENDETRRQNQLDKSLDVILDETYEKMLHYTHDLKTPITTLHMLGIVLPILGLVILPLLTAFIQEARWYHIAAVYNVFLPIMVYYIGRDVLSTRPSGYGGGSMAKVEEQKDSDEVSYQYSDSGGFEVTPAVAGTTVFILLFLMGLSPIIVHQVNPEFDVLITSGGFALPGGVEPGESVYMALLDYRELQTEDGSTQIVGPYGVGASIISLLIPLSFALGLFTYYRLQIKDVVEIREETEELEQEFASALFQLGNRLGDGVPAELAFSNVSKTMEDSKSAKFFDIVTVNIGRLGMGVRNAIFDKEVGAMKFFPSSIIESSMKVFVESVKKGPKVASQALITVAEYIKSMHRVDERLKDLLADIVSSMRSQINFLTPIIAGVVVGITSMISQILGALSDQLSSVTSEIDSGEVAVGGAQGILDAFGSGGIPTFHFQVIVGLYVVQITFILSIMINGIENGIDEVSKKDLLRKNLFRSGLLYAAVAGLLTIGFSAVANGIISGITT